MPGREGRGGEGGRRHLPGTMRLGWGGREIVGACRLGCRSTGREPCAAGRGASPLVLSLPESTSADLCQILSASPPLQREQTPGPAGQPTESWDPRPSSPRCCPMALGSPAWPQGWLCSPLLQGGGKGGKNALLCLLAAESISQVSAAPHPTVPFPACIPPSIPGSCHSILPFVSPSPKTPFPRTLTCSFL